MTRIKDTINWKWGWGRPSKNLLILFLILAFTLGNATQVMATRTSEGFPDGMQRVLVVYDNDGYSINGNVIIDGGGYAFMQYISGETYFNGTSIGSNYNGGFGSLTYPISVRGLTSGGRYNLITNFTYIFYNAQTATGSNIVYTDVVPTSLPWFEDVKDQSVTIKWNTNNLAGTKYVIQRRASTTSSWDNSDIYTTTSTSYKDTNLIPETTYYYRIRAEHQYIDDSVAYSNQNDVTTAAHPAVAAAQEAASKAEAAREAAVLSQAASEKAESKASEAVELIKNLKTNFADLEASFSPTIISIKGFKGATATKGNDFAVDVTAANATYYRAGVNGNYTAWQSSPRIDNISLPNSGVNTIEVQAKRSNADDAPAASGYLTVFKLN